LGRRQKYFSHFQHFNVLLGRGPKISAAFLDVDAQFKQGVTWPQIDPFYSWQREEKEAVKSAHFGELGSDESSDRLNQMQLFLPNRQKDCIDMLQFPAFVQVSQSSDVLQLTLGRQQQDSSFLQQLPHCSYFRETCELP
jgi:hypothetical protein